MTLKPSLNPPSLAVYANTNATPTSIEKRTTASREALPLASRKKSRNDKQRNNNTTNGILLIDKPAGVSSFRCVEIVRRKLQIRKVGHAGTLDPFATGLLILLLGKMTKLQKEFMEMDKCYKAEICFGSETDTLDPTGETIKVSETRVDAQSIKTAIDKHFQGEILQTPPNYSAVKVSGKRAYALARKGIDVKLPLKKVHIKNFNLVRFDEQTQIAEVELEVSSGTYVRSIARELANKLNTVAHVGSLKRTSIGDLTLERAVSISESEFHKKEEGLAKDRKQADTKPIPNTSKTHLQSQPLPEQKVTAAELFSEETSRSFKKAVLSIEHCLPSTVHLLSANEKKKLWAAKHVGNYNMFLPLLQEKGYAVLLLADKASTTKPVAVLKKEKSTDTNSQTDKSTVKDNAQCLFYDGELMQ